MNGFINKILYYSLKFLKKTQTDYLLYKKIINVNIYHIHLKKKKILQDKVTLESYLFQFFLGQCQIANLAIKDIWKKKKKKLKSYGLTPPCARAMAVIVAVDHKYEK